MTSEGPAKEEKTGRLAENIVYFARALRADLSQLEAEEFLARWATVEH